MELLDSNSSFLLISSVALQRTYLLSNPSCSVVASTSYYTVGSLQYATGIAAFAVGSKIRFYDFLLGRETDTFDSLLTVVSVKVLKNLLICISPERILIHNLQTSAPVCHIALPSPTPLTMAVPRLRQCPVSLNSDYYSLKLLYPALDGGSEYYEKDVWGSRTRKLECKGCTHICHDWNAGVLCVVEGQTRVGLYVGGEVVRGCEFEERVVDVVPSKTVDGKFYIVTEASETAKKFFVEFSLTSKTYLKTVKEPLPSTSLLQELSQADPSLSSSENPYFYFEHKQILHIVSNSGIFATQGDLEPQFLHRGRELSKQKIDDFGFRISNLEENKQLTEEERLEAEFFKDVEDEAEAQRGEGDEEGKKNKESQEQVKEKLDEEDANISQNNAEASRQSQNLSNREAEIMKNERIQEESIGNS